MTIPESFSTLSERLVFALKIRNISQAELARQIGISQQAVQHLCKGNLSHSKFTFEIAAALNISIVWLATGQGAIDLDEDRHKKILEKQKKVPILSVDQIERYYIKKISSGLNLVEEYLLSDVSSDKSCFAFKLQDKSMHPRFDQNTIVIVDRDVKPSHLSFVVAHIKDIDAIVFRQLLLHEKKFILEPVNKTIFNSITLEDLSQVIGTLVEARWSSNF